MECNDKNCPIHGSLRVRGMIVRGRVVSTRMRKTVVVERSLFKLIPKYKRRAKTKSKLHAHLPECIKVSVGDEVEIGQTRKLSKTKGWVVLKVLKKEPETKVEEEGEERRKEKELKEKKQVKRPKGKKEGEKE